MRTAEAGVSEGVLLPVVDTRDLEESEPAELRLYICVKEDGVYNWDTFTVSSLLVHYSLQLGV